MRKRIAACCFAVVAIPACVSSGPAAPTRATAEPGIVRYTGTVMGTTLEIAVRAEDRARADADIAAALAELRRLQALLSSWEETSELSAINRAAGRDPVAASAVRASRGLSDASGDPGPAIRAGEHEACEDGVCPLPPGKQP